jgi:hypothetical protein
MTGLPDLDELGTTNCKHQPRINHKLQKQISKQIPNSKFQNKIQTSGFLELGISIIVIYLSFGFWLLLFSN